MAVRAPSSLPSIVDRKRSSGSCQLPTMLAKFVGLATKAMRVSDLSGLSSCFRYENRLQVVDLQPIFAERQGFEPWVPVRVQRFSRPSRSTTPASFQYQQRGLCVSGCKGRYYFWFDKISNNFFCPGKVAALVMAVLTGSKWGQFLVAG